MGYLDLWGREIARLAAAQGWDFEVCAEDGSYLYRTFRDGVVRTLSPGEFAALVGAPSAAEFYAPGANRPQ
jgi:hypothetical protein